VKLSFCIPTYNHGKFLGAALESILAQAPEDFEIVIVDGASVDDTAAVVGEFQRRTSAIVYRRIEHNRGVDPDIAEAVALATGDYCWLMSSDDVIPHGAVARILAEIEAGHDLYIGGRTECTRDLRAFGTRYPFSTQTSSTWNFAAERELVAHLESATCLMAVYAYISVLVFRRTLWGQAERSASYYGCCYAHAHTLLQALHERGSVRFVREPIVMCRMDNDSFASLGFYRRSMLDFDAYMRIADDVLGARPRVRAAYLQVLRRERNVLRLAKLYAACKDEAQARAVDDRVRRAAYTTRQVFAAKALAAAGPLLGAAVIVRRGVTRAVGRWRNAAAA
jgi:abequosyltransferase